jgi:SAM-dependent methyltransferase
VSASEETPNVRKLDDTQAAAFNEDYAEGGRWDAVKACIDRDFAGGDFSFLDIGGGNGRFADRLLLRYPNARGTVLDNSQVLLALNVPNERKDLICKSVESVSDIKDRFDLISVHWLLHHLVGESYSQTRRNQMRTLRALRALLTPRGRISVFENMYQGWVREGLPGWLSYHITSARRIAWVVSRMGANTAGVGVCFLSKREWLTTFHETGLEVLSYAEPDNWVWPLRLEWRILLHLKHIRVGHVWLRADVSATGRNEPRIEYPRPVRR